MPALGARPATPALGLTAGLLALLGVAALGYAALQVAGINPSRPAVGLGTALLLVGYGAVLLVAARGVWRGRRWSRGPAMATSLIQLPVAWSFTDGQTWWVALGLAAISITVVICLLLKSSTAVFVPQTAADD